MPWQDGHLTVSKHYLKSACGAPPSLRPGPGPDPKKPAGVISVPPLMSSVPTLRHRHRELPGKVGGDSLGHLHSFPPGCTESGRRRPSPEGLSHAMHVALVDSAPGAAVDRAEGAGGIPQHPRAAVPLPVLCSSEAEGESRPVWRPLGFMQALLPPLVAGHLQGPQPPPSRSPSWALLTIVTCTALFPQSTFHTPFDWTSR